MDEKYRVEELKGLMKAGKTAEAVALAGQAVGYNEGEGFVFAALREEGTTPELLEAALEGFVGTRLNFDPYHGYWVHSLSHFTKELWTRRMLSWIKRLNEIAFRGALELGDVTCCDRLVEDLERHGLWSDAPEDVGLIPENLAWLKVDEYRRCVKARIDAGAFASEADYVAWRLRQLETWKKVEWFADGYEHSSVPLTRVQTLIAQLDALVDDIAEFKTMFEVKLREQLARYEAARSKVKDPRFREMLEQSISNTRTVLAGLTPTA